MQIVARRRKRSWAYHEGGIWTHLRPITRERPQPINTNPNHNGKFPVALSLSLSREEFTESLKFPEEALNFFVFCYGSIALAIHCVRFVSLDLFCLPRFLHRLSREPPRTKLTTGAGFTDWALRVCPGEQAKNSSSEVFRDLDFVRDF